MPTTYTVIGSEARIFCNEDTSTDDIEITIDPAVIALRKEPLPIIKVGSATYTTEIIPSSGNISGATSLVLSAQYDTALIVSDGTDLYTL